MLSWPSMITVGRMSEPTQRSRTSLRTVKVTSPLVTFPTPSTARYRTTCWPSAANATGAA
ncbi:Uncharacterised protein [Mycobacteroides abscessus]|nr:Uncharacterised protein [Mycobacteroides abscessus]